MPITWCHPSKSIQSSQRLSYPCSRPTAVNLSDAAHKLGSLAQQKAAESNSNGNSVTVAVIEACKQMLQDDVAANKVPSLS